MTSKDCPRASDGAIPIVFSSLRRVSLFRFVFSFRALLVIVVTVALLLVAEFAFRLCAPLIGIDERVYEEIAKVARTGRFQYAPHTYSAFTRHRNFANDVRWADGVVGSEDTFTVLCIGGSTTEGGNDAGPNGSYPTQLRRFLVERMEREVAVFNGGVSGWTSAESLTAYFLEYQDIRIDALVIHHAANDVGPICLNGFEVDYSHYRRSLRFEGFGALESWIVQRSQLYIFIAGLEQRLTLNRLTNQGEEPGRYWDLDPPQHAFDTFIRNVESIGSSASAAGAHVVIATMPYAERYLPKDTVDRIDKNNEELRACASRNEWTLLDYDELFRGERKDELQAVFFDGVHLEPPGNAAKADWAAQALL